LLGRRRNAGNDRVRKKPPARCGGSAVATR
jgi:hypothetical protein